MSIKYFTGYDDDVVNRPLWIMLPQMIGYVKCFGSNKTISFKVSDKKNCQKSTPKYREELAVSLVKNLIVILFMVIVINTSRQK